MSIRFPGESPEYRRARDEVLKAEIDLRKRVTDLAVLRSKMPMGGAVPLDYVFDEGVEGSSESRKVKLSELFGDKSTLLLYSYMFGPEMEAPCPMCTSMLDAVEGQVDHVRQRAAIAIVARSPIARVREFTRARGWKRHRVLSSSSNSYHADYFGETKDGAQMPMMNVFAKREGKVHHFWGSEMLYCSFDDGGDSRHVDQFWPLWHLLDVTPEGRGTDFYPRLKY
jgi:predicted dithiol-disulfide oxidoreductase (DUF899 family)